MAVQSRNPASSGVGMTLSAPFMVVPMNGNMMPRRESVSPGVGAGFSF